MNEDPNIKDSRLLREPERAPEEADALQDLGKNEGDLNYVGMPYNCSGPVTGNTHILLQYSPKVKPRKRLQMLRMQQMSFYHKQNLMGINKEHYYPSFIATRIDELRAQRATR